MVKETDEGGVYPGTELHETVTETELPNLEDHDSPRYKQAPGEPEFLNELDMVVISAVPHHDEITDESPDSSILTEARSVVTSDG